MSPHPGPPARPRRRRRLRHQRRGDLRELIRRGVPAAADRRGRPRAGGARRGRASRGVAVLEGDATRNATLEAVKIERAKMRGGLGRARRHLDPDRAHRARHGAARADQRRGQGRGQRGSRAPGRRHHRHQPGELRRAPARRLGARAAHRRVHGRPRGHRRQRRAPRAQGHRGRGRPAALGDRHRPRRADLPRRQVLSASGSIESARAAAGRHHPRDRAAPRAARATA